MKTAEKTREKQLAQLQQLQMHNFGESGAGVPAFLAKLWRLVDDPDTNNLICWSKDGRSFIIQNQAQFARELLPLNYKHNNMASFIRQLNMYGFHKITSIDNGGLKFDRDEMEFSHPCFKRNCPHLLEHIKRKIANNKNVEDKSLLKTEAVSKVLLDVKAMKGRQDTLDNRFSAMKQENEALWREIATLRQKHAKQQQIVNKLIQFLITIVQPSRNMGGVNRSTQLMINDTPDYGNFRKTSESESDCGPVIHELEEELLDEVEQELMNPTSPYLRAHSVSGTDAENPSPLNLERPHSSISLTSQNYDCSNQSGEDVQAATPKNAENSVAANQGAAVSAIIQSVNPDGTESIYHVTEVPDAHPQEVAGAVPACYNEENVLTTPMVRNLLKQKNKQRRNEERTVKISTQSANINNLVIPTKMSRANKSTSSGNGATNEVNPLNIKIEKEIDPIFYLNVGYADPSMLSPNSPYSPNLLEGNSPSCMSPQIIQHAEAATTAANENENVNDEANNMNEPNKLSGNAQANSYENCSLLSNDATSFGGKNMKSNQMQYGNANNSQFSSFADESNGLGITTDAQFASTSAAAAAAVTNATTATATTSNNNGNTMPTGEIDNNMAVTKYKNDDTMRSDVHGHLDNVQDELESLKELLRGDNYSLDTSTLINLFNDSDILGPYGFCLPSEETNDKKGSELMTYQPNYDLLDIMNLNDKTNLDDHEGAITDDAPSMPSLESTLNTPYHA